MFATRITYVVKRGTRFELQVADADGFGAQTVLASNEPIISPAWSPDGTRLAYVSFEQQKPVVYVQSLATGQRKRGREFPRQQQRARVVARRPPARRRAHQGRRLADLSDQCRRRRAPRASPTAPASIPSPTSRPTGSWLLFTSDRGGSPQIYRMPASRRRGASG